MTEHSPTVRIDREDPAFQAVVTAAVDRRVRDIRAHDADLIDTEATARSRRGHDTEHIAGWREAAEWLREQAVKP